MSPLRPDSVGTRTVDLLETLLDVANILQDDALTVWIFGSRRYKTRSPRSDIDLLIQCSTKISQEQAREIWKLEPYLDVFETTHGVAMSIVNGSQIAEPTLDGLIERLDATPLMDQGSWLTAADVHQAQTVLAERNPAASLVPLYDLEDAIPAERADVLVLTALPLEHEAVLEAFGGRADGSAGVLCHVADHKSSMWRVMVRTVNTMGSVAMALATTDAIRRTKASHVVLVGICAGVPNRSRLLDVIVPTTVAYYEPGKVTTKGIEQDYAHLQLDAAVAAHAANLPKTNDLQIKATQQVIACGEKVIADKRERRRLEKSLSRKMSAIDMESYGMVRAAYDHHRRPTVIKAVCDLGDRSKNDQHQPEAARRAALTLRRMIESGAFAADI